MSESTPHSSRKPDPQSVPVGCIPHSTSRPIHSLQPIGTSGKMEGGDSRCGNLVPSWASRPPDVLDNQSALSTRTALSHKPEAIRVHSQTSLDSEMPMFPALNGGYVQDSAHRIVPSPGFAPGAGSGNADHKSAEGANRFNGNGSGSEQEERSTCSDSSPSPSLRASAGSPANSAGLRKDAQGFWEPVTPPCSPPADRGESFPFSSSVLTEVTLLMAAGRGTVSGRSRGSTAESPSSDSSCPDSILTSTPASSVASSTTSPPPDSPSPYCPSESRDSFEPFGAPNPSLLPAFFASATKRKREKASRTREIVDRLKLGSGGEDDSGNDGRPVLDAVSGNTGNVSPYNTAIDWTADDVDELGGKTPSRPPSQPMGTAMHNGSSDQQTPPSEPSKTVSATEAVVDPKAPPAAIKANPDTLPKHTMTAAPISGNGWVAPSGASVHGRSVSSLQSNRTGCSVPVPPSTAPAATTTFQAPASHFLPQPPFQPPVTHTIPPAGLCVQPPPPPGPVVPIPTQQQHPVVFYGPSYPMYAYPVVPLPPQPIGRGQSQPPWLVGYRPPQGGMHPPAQATPITGISGMRHIGW